MKKIYTMFAAAAVGALACSAVNPNPVSPAFGPKAPEFRAMELSKEKVVKANNALGIKKAPAAAAAAAPESLEGIGLTFCYDYNYTTSSGTQLIPTTQVLTMKLESTEEGVQTYSCKGYIDGFFIESVNIHDLEILYEPSTGTLCIPAGQVSTDWTSPDDNVNREYSVFNYRDDKMLYDGVNFYFRFTGDGFEWENPMQVNFDGETEEFTSIGMAACTIITDANGKKSAQSMYVIENLSFRIAQGEMSMTAGLIDQTTGQTTPTDLNGPLFASISGNTITVENFGSPALEFVVPFTVDAQAKTLTCKDVLIGKTETGLNLYLSQAKDLFNVYEEEGEYKIVAPYTCEGNTTTVTIGEWNAFCYNASTKEDLNAYVPFTNTKMVFYFNLDTIMAGVGNIAVDEADSNAPVEYFNLQGVRVQNPENGLYIRRQGKNVTKVIL